MLLSEQAAQAPGAYLQVQHVSKLFGSFAALDNVSLHIEQGEFICFLGPSGCGKTTLLRIIAGLEEQTSGRIIQGGRDISRLGPAQRDFGIVFQSYALFPNLTAAQNVAYGLQNTRTPRAQVEQRVSELLTMVGLTEFGGRYPAQLSGGQQQRVALARALALSPGLLLLDEPLSALDARVRVALRTEILNVHHNLGVTTIMVTHDQEEALAMADRIVVLDRGKIVQVGTPLQVYTAPSGPFVADFVGVMNFIPALAVAPGRVRCGGIEFELGDRVPGAEPGSALTLAVRPEEVQLLHEAHEPERHLQADVVEAAFLGPIYRVRLDLIGIGKNNNGHPLVVHLPASEARRWSLRRGQRLPVGLDTATVNVFASTPLE